MLFAFLGKGQKVVSGSYAPYVFIYKIQMQEAMKFVDYSRKDTAKIKKLLYNKVDSFETQKSLQKNSSSPLLPRSSNWLIGT